LTSPKTLPRLSSFLLLLLPLVTLSLSLPNKGGSSLDLVVKEDCDNPFFEIALSDLLIPVLFSKEI